MPGRYHTNSKRAGGSLSEGQTSAAALVLFITFWTIVTVGKLHAQTPSTFPDLARVGVVDDISATTRLCFSHLRTISPDQLPTLDYSIRGTKKYEHFITPE